MPVRRDWDLQPDVDMVLSAQGADPARLRARGSPAVGIAEQAIAEGMPLIQPAVAFVYMPVNGLTHERLHLGSGNLHLSGALVAERLPAAKEVVAMVCTIGPGLEARASACFPDDPALGVALDGLGTTAVDLLASLACRWVDGQAAERGLRTTIPLSPGLLGWPVAIGQRQVFAAVDAEAAGVRLSDGCMMVPHKSTSLVIGIGPDVQHSGEACDYCSMHATCRYREGHKRHA